jgi:transcriptional antiterminator RfaH
MHWYVIHTKPRQEQRALDNLAQQGYVCYLPMLASEKLRQGALKVVLEPLFARYLFIQLDSCHSSKSWTPIRSTLGVSRLVTFGAEPAKVDSHLIDALRADNRSQCEEPQRLFKAGDQVQINDGAFAGLQAIYQMPSGENRAMVLIEILTKTVKLTLSPASLRKVA